MWLSHIQLHLIRLCLSPSSGDHLPHRGNRLHDWQLVTYCPRLDPQPPRLQRRSLRPLFSPQICVKECSKPPSAPTLPHLFWFSSAFRGNRVHQLFPSFTKSQTLLVQPQCTDTICCTAQRHLQLFSLSEYHWRKTFLCFNFCLFFFYFKVLDVPQHKWQNQNPERGCRLWFNVPPTPPEFHHHSYFQLWKDRTNTCYAALTWSRSVNCGGLERQVPQFLCTWRRNSEVEWVVLLETRRPLSVAFHFVCSANTLTHTCTHA